MFLMILWWHRCFRHADEVALKPTPKTGACVFDALTQIPNDIVCDDRQDSLPQMREVF